MKRAYIFIAVMFAPPVLAFGVVLFDQVITWLR